MQKLSNFFSALYIYIVYTTQKSLKQVSHYVNRLYTALHSNLGFTTNTVSVISTNQLVTSTTFQYISSSPTINLHKTMK